MAIIKHLSAAAAAAVAATVALSAAVSAEANCGYQVGAPVNTTSGRVWGHRAPNATQVSEYLGIPFAQPPVGPLRFAPPQAYNSSSDVHADSYGHDCPSTSSSVPGFLPKNVYNILSSLGQVGDDQQEDCLFMNVWSKPQVGEKKKPVLVWIYGGGFAIGGTNTTAYSGQYFADTEDVVFASFNYRLNSFGFPGSPAETQNAGLLDQRMAIEWLRDNVEAFGGDSERITIFGQSAGGASVDLYSYAWHSDPIIAGQIMQSGTATAFGNRLASSSAHSWYTLTKSLGCGDNTTASDSELLSCMRQPNITAAAITNATATASGTGLAAILGVFGPTIDEKTVFSNYTARAEQGLYTKVPALIGNNNYEAGLFELIAAGSGANIPESIWVAFDLGEFTCPASTAAQLHAMQGVPTWRYMYSGMFPNMLLPTVNYTQAWHGAELLPMFGTAQDNTKVDNTGAENAVGAYMRGAWSAFARCPSAGLSSYGWPRYNASDATLVMLGGNNMTTTGFAMPKDIDINCGFPYMGAKNV